ncbi:hypothetical protein DBV15_08342 [Temnothorax longispinosus]|uniref:Uncharacterized protein n=1 Tax=Temnothorax longispinosus TaxID=300112 RepID=A0A4S2JP68_9HYME|nr:hypothetical protein DBV15_08342 [Temnothorax longispinosus]
MPKQSPDRRRTRSVRRKRSSRADKCRSLVDGLRFLTSATVGKICPCRRLPRSHQRNVPSWSTKCAHRGRLASPSTTRYRDNAASRSTVSIVIRHRRRPVGNPPRDKPTSRRSLRPTEQPEYIVYRPSAESRARQAARRSVGPSMSALLAACSSGDGAERSTVRDKEKRERGRGTGREREKERRDVFPTGTRAGRARNVETRELARGRRNPRERDSLRRRARRVASRRDPSRVDRAARSAAKPRTGVRVTEGESRREREREKRVGKGDAPLARARANTCACRGAAGRYANNARADSCGQSRPDQSRHRVARSRMHPRRRQEEPPEPERHGGVRAGSSDGDVRVVTVKIRPRRAITPRFPAPECVCAPLVPDINPAVLLLLLVVVVVSSSWCQWCGHRRGLSRETDATKQKEKEKNRHGGVRARRTERATDRARRTEVRKGAKRCCVCVRVCVCDERARGSDGGGDDRPGQSVRHSQKRRIRPALPLSALQQRERGRERESETDRIDADGPTTTTTTLETRPPRPPASTFMRAVDTPPSGTVRPTRLHVPVASNRDISNRPTTRTVLCRRRRRDGRRKTWAKDVRGTGENPAEEKDPIDLPGYIRISVTIKKKHPNNTNKRRRKRIVFPACETITGFRVASARKCVFVRDFRDGGASVFTQRELSSGGYDIARDTCSLSLQERAREGERERGACITIGRRESSRREAESIDSDGEDRPARRETGERMEQRQRQQQQQQQRRRWRRRGDSDRGLDGGVVKLAAARTANSRIVGRLGSPASTRGDDAFALVARDSDDVARSPSAAPVVCDGGTRRAGASPEGRRRALRECGSTVPPLSASAWDSRVRARADRGGGGGGEVNPDVRRTSVVPLRARVQPLLVRCIYGGPSPGVLPPPGNIISGINRVQTRFEATDATSFPESSSGVARSRPKEDSGRQLLDLIRPRHAVILDILVSQSSSSSSQRSGMSPVTSLLSLDASGESARITRVSENAERR